MSASIRLNKSQSMIAGVCNLCHIILFCTCYSANHTLPDYEDIFICICIFIDYTDRYNRIHNI